MLGERLERGAQLLSGVEAAAFAAQPLPVQKVRPGELESHTGTGEVRDRLAVQALGDLALAQQRAHARFDSARPPGADRRRSAPRATPARLEQRSVAGPGCRLGQLGHEQRSVSDRIGLERFPGRIARGVMSAEAVVEHGSRVVVGRPSPRGRLLRAWLRSARTPAPRRRARQRGSSGRSRAPGFRSPRRSSVLRRSVSAAAVSSPASMWLLARKLSANCRCTSAPVSRATCTWRAARRCSASSSHSSSATMLLSLLLESESHRPTSSLETSSREQKLESPGECRRRGRVSVGQADRERVEQHVDRPRRSGAGRRRPRGRRDRRRAADDFDVAGHGAPERLEVRLAGQLGVEWLEAARRAQKQAAGVAAAPLLQRDLASQEVDPRPPELVEQPGLDACQQPERSLQIAGIALGAGGREQALRTVRGLRRERGGALEEGSDGRQSAARLRPPSGTLELCGDVLVGHRRRLRPVPGAAIRIDLRIGCFRQRAVDSAPLVRLGRPIDRRANERMTEDHSDTELQQAFRLRPSPQPTRGSRAAGPPATRAPGRPIGSAAARSNRRRASPGSRASRRVKLSSMLADNGTAAGSPNPPASSTASARAAAPTARAGCRASRRRSAPARRSSRRAGRTDSSSARASRWPSGSTRSSGNPASASPTSRAANTSAILSASRRRATNASARADARSSHCASSTTHSSGRSSAASDSRPRTASPTRNGFGACPALSPKATLSASRWGSGRRSDRSRIGEHSCCSAAKGSSISPSTPTARSTRSCRPSSTIQSSSAVFPTPGSPCTTNTPPSPPRAAVEQRGEHLALALPAEQLGSRGLRARRNV